MDIGDLNAEQQALLSTESAKMLLAAGVPIEELLHQLEQNGSSGGRSAHEGAGVAAGARRPDVDGAPGEERLKQRVLELKKQAVALKKAGDKAGAIAALREAKKLEGSGETDCTARPPQCSEGAAPPRRVPAAMPMAGADALALAIAGGGSDAEIADAELLDDLRQALLTQTATNSHGRPNWLSLTARLTSPVLSSTTRPHSLACVDGRSLTEV